MQRTNLMQRRQLIRGAMALSMIVMCTLILAMSGVWLSQPVRRANAATPWNAKLLLVHGFDDSCQDAFVSQVLDTNGVWEYGDAMDYLTQYGWPRSAIDLVGYYNYTLGHVSEGMNGVQYDTYDFTPGETAPSNPPGISAVPCDSNLQEWRTLASSTGASKCDSAFSSASANFGTLSDPIEHLGCLLAWYIYDTYTLASPSVPVYILAHSMGGLIVRDAIGESGSSNAAFPSGKIDVRSVITLGTPHGGLWGFYLDAAKNAYGSPTEILNMDSTSTFMDTTMNSLQRPQGSSGTYWELIAGSTACALLGGGTAAYNCQPYNTTANAPFPDGDGVVQSDSALAMTADYKILYGNGDCVPASSNPCNSSQSNTFNADPNIGDPSSAYSHQANACHVKYFITFCLAYPYYLNDFTAPSQRTLAYTCSGASTCTAGDAGGGGMADMKVLDSSGNSLSGQSVPYSMGEVINRFPAPSPPPTPTPTPTTAPACSTTTEYDNNQDSMYTDNRGNGWHVYYDIKRDTPTGLPCQMRVVVRIFNPWPDGAWSGTAAVWAEKNGGYLSASFGKVTGSCTYQYHFVWRGPWFNVGTGNYYIEDTEYNGSNAYRRAVASFSI